MFVALVKSSLLDRYIYNSCNNYFNL